MKKIVFGFLLVLVVLTIASCGKEKEKISDMPEMLEVNLTVKPNQGQMNQPMTFEAKVTQGDEEVNDADKVIFEIWRSNEKHERIEIKHAENGIYRLEKSFPQEGTYYIISHVTARDMHNMPKKEFIVGTASESEKAKSNDSMEGMDMDEHDDSGN